MTEGEDPDRVPGTRWLPSGGSMDFSARHIGPSPAEQEQMLAAVGYPPWMI
jgi:hypothetical protein